MDSIQKWRKSNPPAPGFIPYGPFSYQDEHGCVYSLDKFRPRFWFPLAVRRDNPKYPDKEPAPYLPTSEQDRISAVYEVIRRAWLSWQCEGVKDPPRMGEAKIHGNVAWWSCAGVIFTLQKYKPFGSQDYTYNLLLEFNPNKCDLSFVKCFVDQLASVDWSKYTQKGRWSWSNTRLDYALDIPFPISDVRLLTRKVGSCFQGTYYFGTRGSSGYTRVYDKRKEIIDKQKRDIGREVTRIEWENHHSLPMHMDFPFLIQNLGRYEVLRFVPMNDWPAALRTFHPDTAAKIKRNCLRCVDVDPALFDALAADLLTYLGLDMDHCDDCEIRKARQQDIDDQMDLEKIQSTLRKWSNIED